MLKENNIYRNINERKRIEKDGKRKERGERHEPLIKVNRALVIRAIRNKEIRKKETKKERSKEINKERKKERKKERC